MLNMQSVSKIFHVGTIQTHALRNIDIQVEQGEFVAVTGPSGSGKTTFLNIAGLLDEFESGRYLLDGKDVSRLSDDERSEHRNQKIGYVFQAFNLIPDIDVQRNIEVPLRYRGMPAKERRRRVDSALEKVGLRSRTGHFPGELSGGQQQRVAIARALSGDPRLLLADEPTGNLDSEMAQEVLELLFQINREGTTIVMVTHDMNLAARAGRIIRIIDGAVALSP